VDRQATALHVVINEQENSAPGATCASIIVCGMTDVVRLSDYYEIIWRAQVRKESFAVVCRDHDRKSQ